MRAFLPRRLISLFLVCAILLSCVSVLAMSAGRMVARAASDDVTLLLNRNFDDGKELDNGIHDVVTNSADTDSISFAKTSDGNKYINIEKKSQKDAFINIQLTGYIDTLKSQGGYLVAKYDIMSNSPPTDIGGVFAITGKYT